MTNKIVQFDLKHIKFDYSRVGKNVILWQIFIPAFEFSPFSGSLAFLLIPAADEIIFVCGVIGPQSEFSKVGSILLGYSPAFLGAVAGFANYFGLLYP